MDATEDNAKNIVAALDAFRLRCLGLDFLEPDIVTEPYRSSYETDRREFADAYPRRVSVPLDEIVIPVIDRESLIANESALGRPHDLDDVKGIE